MFGCGDQMILLLALLILHSSLSLKLYIRVCLLPVAYFPATARLARSSPLFLSFCFAVHFSTFLLLVNTTFILWSPWFLFYSFSFLLCTLQTLVEVLNYVPSLLDWLSMPDLNKWFLFSSHNNRKMCLDYNNNDNKKGIWTYYSILKPGELLESFVSLDT